LQRVDFARVRLDLRESATAEFHVPMELLAYYDRDMNLVIVRDDVQLSAGGSSAELPVSVTVAGNRSGWTGYEKDVPL
jgi:hypothetical protein